MKNISRLSMAAILVGILVVAATGVWAAPKFQGTVPPPAGEGGSQDGSVIDMGTALFDPLCTDCTVVVTLVGSPETLAPAPEGMNFMGDTFAVTTEPADAAVQVCYSYSPDATDKNAKIYKLNTEAVPAAWVEVPGSTIENGVICVTSGAGTFTLIGDN